MLKFIKGNASMKQKRRLTDIAILWGCLMIHLLELR
nr:MAG TPA: hypothetical protein [Caudoviricetes sp.]